MLVNGDGADRILQRLEYLSEVRYMNTGELGERPPNGI